MAKLYKSGIQTITTTGTYTNLYTVSTNRKFDLQSIEVNNKSSDDAYVDFYDATDKKYTLRVAASSDTTRNQNQLKGFYFETNCRAYVTNVGGGASCNVDVAIGGEEY